MKATIFHGPRDVRVERVPDPGLTAPSDAIVRITRAAICGSDLHVYDGGTPVESGFVLGHEGVGVIEDTGSGVTRLRKGQRVVVSAVVACGECFYCRRNQPSQCDATGGSVFGFGKMAARKLGDVGGEQSEAVRVPMADYTCYPLPDGVDDDAAVFLADILPTAYFGALNGDIRPGDVVAVFGCGPVGLCAVIAAQLFGPAEVIAVDSVAYRLELARKLGATPVTLEQARDLILNRTDGRGADVTIEAVGTAGALGASFENVRGGGTVSMVGVMGRPTWEYPMMLAFAKDLTFRVGLANINAHIPELARLIEHKRIDPRPIVSHVMPLDEVPRGYKIFDARAEGAIKILIKP
jgi:alcohol dehydrogenase